LTNIYVMFVWLSFPTKHPHPNHYELLQLLVFIFLSNGMYPWALGRYKDVSSQDLDIQRHMSWFCICVQWIKMQGNCSHCWYW